VKLITSWRDLPPGIRNHLDDRLKRIPDFQVEAARLDFWFKSMPDVPEGQWFKDFRTFIVCGEGPFIRTFLDGDMKPRGIEVF